MDIIGKTIGNNSTYVYTPILLSMLAWDGYYHVSLAGSQIRVHLSCDSPFFGVPCSSTPLFRKRWHYFQE